MNDLPQLQAIVSVQVIGDGVQASGRDVLRWKEGAVVHASKVPFHEFHYSVISKRTLTSTTVTF